MIRVILGNNVDRHEENVDENKTIRQALEEYEVDYSAGMIFLDGSSVKPGDLDHPFVELGYAPGSRCSLSVIRKLDNA